MEPVKCIGRCVSVFFMAIVFDIVGLVLLFIGIFANLRIEGRFYGDFLIYTGSLLVFFSLGPWLMWYVGNVQVPVDDGLQGKRSTIARLARKLSERLSQKLKGEERVKCVRENDEEEESSEVGSPHKASRVTWGRSTTYHNGGYDGSMDSPDDVKKFESGKDEKLESDLHI
ncbi:transmembrane protein 238-like [Notolabrus celidotus]|uniref:transmembrane protein 238-like n=1 Tax=Notolabrus celidotus TaxID=1203425 RepID=UPI0014907777|nr:transmembrane protein 238-like [Notolabrus celidotus]